MGKVAEAIGALVLVFAGVTLLGAGFFLDEIQVTSKMIGDGLDAMRQSGRSQQQIYCDRMGNCDLLGD